MEHIPNPEHTFEYLKDTYVYITKMREESGRAQIIILRAKVLDVPKGNSVDDLLLKVQFEGNNNLVFDDQVEEDVTLDKVLRNISDPGLPIIETEKLKDENEIGTWKYI